MSAHITPAAMLITDRGGAAPGYANDPAKLLLCNLWLGHARPIIQAMFVLEDDADTPILNALVKTDTAWQQNDYREARREITKAYTALHDMLDGIRDNFICDERAGIGDNDDETQEADDFNDWLTDNTITVDQAIAIVAAERDAVFYGKLAA